MIGGPGNDTYVVDNAGDVVIEAASGGTDTVQASVSFMLAAERREPDPDRQRAINGTGNTLANILIGNAARTASTAARRRHDDRRRRQRHLRRRQCRRHDDRAAARRHRHGQSRASPGPSPPSSRT